MRWSAALIPTLRDNPADAEFPSHQLLVRGGFIRRLAAGLYSFLPLGQRTMQKILAIVREEMNAIGGQEFLLPSLRPVESGDEAADGPSAEGTPFLLKDGAGRDLSLGVSHEEVFAELARSGIRSYKDLPQIWYRIQPGFNDEPRPGSGLLRTRQFTLSGSCSFDSDVEGLNRSCGALRDACARILERCGLEFVEVEGSSAAAGEGLSREFMVRTDAGEEPTVECGCGYRARLERATSRVPEVADDPYDGAPREVHTPGRKTIAEIADFLGVDPAHQIKSLVYIAGDRPLLFVVRGDHQLNEAKALALPETAGARPASAEEIRAAFGADAGSLGPVGVTGMAIYADPALQGRRNMTCGANRTDYHLQGVTPGVHFSPHWIDLRVVEPGEACAECGAPLRVYQALNVGRVTRPGARHCERAGAKVLTAAGSEAYVLMGSSVLHLERVLSAAVELRHDADGIVWPLRIAPFSVILTPVNYRDGMREAADRLYTELRDAGLDALLDDRAERAGVKFKDADLIGIPYRIVIGPENLKQGMVELFERASRTKQPIPIPDVLPELQRRMHIRSAESEPRAPAP